MIIFSKDTCPPCKNLKKMLGQVTNGPADDSFFTAFSIDPENIVQDEIQNRTFTGQDVQKYIFAKYGLRTVPSVFFDG